jgi:hypothetical protein
MSKLPPYTVAIYLLDAECHAQKASEAAKRIGVEDSTYIRFGYEDPAPFLFATVSETYAAQFLHPVNKCGEAGVHPALLLPGDVIKDQDQHGTVYRLAKLSPERILELYLATRISGLQSQNRYLKDKNKK